MSNSGDQKLAILLRILLHIFVLYIFFGFFKYFLFNILRIIFCNILSSNLSLLCKGVMLKQLLVVKNFVLSSQLNGHNGEVTNGDDVAELINSVSCGNGVRLDFILTNSGDSRNRRWIRITYLGVQRFYNRDSVTEFCAFMAFLEGYEEVPGGVAFLNGLNGEATNSDDVTINQGCVDRVSNHKLDTQVCDVVDSKPLVNRLSSARDRMAQKLRLEKEAKTTRFSKNPGSSKKNVKFGPPDNVVSVLDLEKKLMMKEPPVITPSGECKVDPPIEEEKPVDTLYVIPQDLNSLFYDGENYHKEPFGPIWAGGNLCKDCGPGWVLSSSSASKNRKPVSRTPCLSTTNVEGYYRRDGTGLNTFYPEQTFVVVEPLLAVLRKNLPAANIDESLANACIALAGKTSVPDDMQASTVAFYLCIIHRKGTVVKGTTGLLERITNNGSIIGCGDFGRIDETVKLGVELNLNSALFEHDVECEETPYVCRDDYLILDPTHTHTTVEEPRRVRFNPVRVHPKRRGRTRFFSFRGRGQPTFVEYSDSANNLNQGLKRLLGARDGELVHRQNAIRLGHKLCSLYKGPHNSDVRSMYKKLLGARDGPVNGDQLHDDVRRYVAENVKTILDECGRTKIQRVLDTVMTGSSWLYYSIYHDILTTFQPLMSREAAANIVHVKRALRREYVNSRRLHTDEDIMVNRMQACIKRELAKFGKVPRLFVSYDAGAMYANELPEFVKMCIDGMHIFNYMGKTMALYIMAKPRDGVMSALFTKLKEGMSTPGFLQVIIFSDDSCISGCDDTSFGYNVDISSNDSSQDIPAFLAAYLSLRKFHKRRAEGLVSQCLLPVAIVNPEDSRDKIAVQFEGPYEGSGTVLTTILNHFASVMIYLSVFKLWADGMAVHEAIPVGAGIIGHVVTLEPWGLDRVTLEKAQFLKRSPVCIGGVWQPQVNLGCILRSMGSVDDELDAVKLGVSQSEFLAMTMDQRMTRFFSAVVAGWCHESDNSILAALRKRFNPSNAEIMVKHDSLSFIGDETIVGFSDDGLYNRYNLTASEIQEAVILISNIQLGKHVSCDAFSKIYAVDYGLPL